MVHSAVFGQTKTGKTWLLKRRAKILNAANQKVLVHSGTGDTDWPGAHTVPRGSNRPITELFFSAEAFEEALDDESNYGAFVMVDEASVLFKQQATSPRDFPTIYNLGQMGRHRGFTCMFATQYPTALAHNVRVNCETWYVFRLGSKKYARMVCDDAGLDDAWAAEIVKLPQLNFLHIRPMEAPKRMRLQ